MRYYIENEFLKAGISDLGATLTDLIEKETGINCVLGFDTDEEYLEKGGCVGMCVGRNANRIGNARFTLNGVEYQLTENNHGNQLHGGQGFNTKQFKLVSQKKDEVVLSYFSKDGEEGFPGNLEVTITYRLEGNGLNLYFEGVSDKDTVFNMTNHAYFNLGDEDILNEELCIYSSKYSPTDEFSLTLDEVLDTKGTPYCFDEFTTVKENIEKIPGGIDNNYVFENMEYKKMASLRNEKLILDVYSNLPDMHLYTAAHLKECSGRGGEAYGPCKGLALECQYYPNAINYSKYIKPILHAGEKRKDHIEFKISRR